MLLVNTVPQAGQHSRQIVTIKLDPPQAGEHSTQLVTIKLDPSQ